MTFPDLFSWTVNFNWAWQGAASRLFWRICHLLWVECTAKIQSVYLKLLLTNESKKIYKNVWMTTCMSKKFRSGHSTCICVSKSAVLHSLTTIEYYLSAFPVNDQRPILHHITELVHEVRSLVFGDGMRGRGMELYLVSFGLLTIILLSPIHHFLLFLTVVNGDDWEREASRDGWSWRIWNTKWVSRLFCLSHNPKSTAGSVSVSGGHLELLPPRLPPKGVSETHPAGWLTAVAPYGPTVSVLLNERTHSWLGQMNAAPTDLLRNNVIWLKCWTENKQSRLWPVTLFWCLLVENVQMFQVTLTIALWWMFSYIWCGYKDPFRHTTSAPFIHTAWWWPPKL